MSQKVMLGKRVLKTRLVCLGLNSKQVGNFNEPFTHHLFCAKSGLNEILNGYCLPRCCGLDDFE